MSGKDPDLWKASEEGDLLSVRTALAGGQSANTRGGEFEWNCLFVAVRQGHEDVVTELLQQEDCDPSPQPGTTWTVLHHACRYGRVGIVRQLALHPRQSSLNVKDYRNTAIMEAVEHGQAECVLALGRVPGVDLDTMDSAYIRRSLEAIAR